MRPFWTLRRQLLAWSALGGLALAYLLALVYLPQFRGADDGRLALAPQPDAAHGTGGESADHIAKLHKEIGVLRRQLDEVQEHNQQLNRRLGLIEDAVGTTTSSLPTRTQPNDITTSLRREKRPPRPAPALSVRYLPLPADGFAEVGVEGSPLPVAGLPAPTQTLFGVELGTAASPELLRKQWAALARRHRSLLGPLEARRTSGRRDGRTEGTESLSLIAGPFPNASGAAMLCARLRAAGTSCKETVFTGEAL